MSGLRNDIRALDRASLRRPMRRNADSGAEAYVRIGEIVVDYLRSTRKRRVTVADLENAVIQHAPETTRHVAGRSVLPWRFWVEEWAYGIADENTEGLSAGVARARQMSPEVVAKARRVLA